MGMYDEHFPLCLLGPLQHGLGGCSNGCAEDFTTGQFLEEHRLVFFMLLLLLFLTAFLLMLPLRWLQSNEKRIRQSWDDFCREVVRRLLPSVAVHGLRLRIMRPGWVEQGSREPFQELGFRGLSLEVPTHAGASHVMVLQDVSGAFTAGHLCAVLGPEGAGKAAFLNLMRGGSVKGEVSGQILVNGMEWQAAQLKTIAGFVPRHDVVHSQLTVRENLRYAAELWAPELSRRKRAVLVDDILRVMQIRHIQRNTVGSVQDGGITVGQRKRVNIGMELAASPAILFLDEPLRNIDNTVALSITYSLKRVAQQGLSIVMSMEHSSNAVFRLLDTALLLGHGGLLAFAGPPRDAVAYFHHLGFDVTAHANPVDCFIDILTDRATHPSMLDFRPARLHAMWCDCKQADLEEARRATGTAALWRGPLRWTDQRDRCALIAALEEEWDKVDTDGNGIVEMDSFRELLVLIAVDVPGEPIVQEVFQRITAGGEAAEEGQVMREQFVHFFVRILEGVQNDPVDKPTSGTQLEVSDDEDPSESDLDSEPPGDRVLEESTFSRHLRVVMQRQRVQVLRRKETRFVEVSAFMILGILLGVLHRCKMGVNQPCLAVNLLNLHLGMGAASATFSVPVFAKDRRVYRSEMSHGLNVYAFFIGRSFVHTIDILLPVCLCILTYYLLSMPPAPFQLFFWPLLLVVYTSSGVGYIIATFMPKTTGDSGPIFFTIILGMLAGSPNCLSSLYYKNLLAIIFQGLWSVPMTLVPMVDNARDRGEEVHHDLEELRNQYKGMIFDGALGSSWWAGSLLLFFSGVVFDRALTLLLLLFFIPHQLSQRDDAVVV